MHYIHLQCNVALMFLHPYTSVRALSCPTVKLCVEGFKLFMHNFHKSAEFAKSKKTQCKALRYLNIKDSGIVHLLHLDTYDDAT